MASAAAFTATLTITGDDTATKTFNAASNATSPAQDQFINLANGDNTITAPVAAVPTRLSIIPPSGNANLLKLKGVGGDTGVPLHKTDQSFIAIDSTVVTLIINSAGATNGVRIIWS